MFRKKLYNAKQYCPPPIWFIVKHKFAPFFCDIPGDFFGNEKIWKYVCYRMGSRSNWGIVARSEAEFNEIVDNLNEQEVRGRKNGKNY